MNYDVVALGELLIDFTGSGISDQGNPLFEANPGGAPGNVLAMLARLGRKTAFIGKVGGDMFGQMLLGAVSDCGIDVSGVVTDPNANTTLAFVRNAPDGDREFAFFRKPGADTLLRPREVDAEKLKNCRIFHFGSLSLTNRPARDATVHAVDTAKKAGALISFDPNLRPLLWANMEEAKRQIAWGCSVCDVLKIAEEELAFLTGETSIDEGVAALRSHYPDIQILFVTRGKNGAEGFWEALHCTCPTFLEVRTVDTTGAGDTFCGCCLSHLLELDIEAPDEEALQRMLIFANAAASLVTTKKGALRAMPDPKEVEALIRTV